MEYLAIVVSAVALVISVLAWRETKRQADAASDVARIEAGRDAAALEAAKSAQIALASERADLGGAVVVRNIGMAVAKSVELDMEVVLGDVGELPYFASTPFPCEIHPGSLARLNFTRFVGGVDRVQVSLQWDDDLGHHQEISRLSLT